MSPAARARARELVSVGAVRRVVEVDVGDRSVEDVKVEVDVEPRDLRIDAGDGIDERIRRMQPIGGQVDDPRRLEAGCIGWIEVAGAGEHDA
jgi:hypothetical protein